MRFMNIKLSALEVLDGRSFYILAVYNPLASAPLHLYHDLYERIEGVFQAKRMIESELGQSEAQTNTEYRDILEQNQWENHETLSKFISQLLDFEPLQFGFHRVVQRLQKAIAAPVTPDYLQCVQIFQQWAEELKTLKSEASPIPGTITPPVREASSQGSPYPLTQCLKRSWK
ncbi:hypothetical protein BJ165DRAFT_1608085 [Panaeolus papilionaceus]|nr:hypothetical protein BJ165DRAFT_1608085 [Panaeolus papilionaceus]